MLLFAPVVEKPLGNSAVLLKDLPGERLLLIAKVEETIDSSVLQGSQVAGHMNVVRC